MPRDNLRRTKPRLFTEQFLQEKSTKELCFYEISDIDKAFPINTGIDTLDSLHIGLNFSRYL